MINDANIILEFLHSRLAQHPDGILSVPLKAVPPKYRRVSDSSEVPDLPDDSVVVKWITTTRRLKERIVQFHDEILYLQALLASEAAAAEEQGEQYRGMVTGSGSIGSRSRRIAVSSRA